MFGFGKKKQGSNSLEGLEVPSFPTTVLTLLGKLRDPDTPINALAEDLEVDPGLHVRVLKTVNSAAFGLSHKVSNIRHAVTLLGRARLEALVLSVAVKDSLAQNNEAAWLDMSKFWATAAQRAAVARGLAVILHPNIQSDVFTIGLLQDMAIPVMASREGTRYREIYQDWQQTADFDLIAQEQHHCGINHATLGQQMAVGWGFPDSLAKAIGAHHSQTDADEIPLSVQIASLIKGQPENDSSQNLLKNAEEKLGLTGITREEIETALAESQELSAALG